MKLRRKATKGLSADQLREALGQLAGQAKPRRQWATAARSAAWRGRWWLVPVAGTFVAWLVGVVIAASRPDPDAPLGSPEASGLGWFPVLLVGLLLVVVSAVLARPLPEKDRPWVWAPLLFVVAYWVATAIGG